VLGGQLITQPATQAPATQAPPKPTVVSTDTTVRFDVTGTGIPSISYGSDSNTTNVAGGLGTLGDGVALPWSATMPLDSSAQYYVINAQLQDGGGSITATISETVTNHYSNSHEHSQTQIIKTATANGNYSIASPEWVAGL
jgi:hypothetical protein